MSVRVGLGVPKNIYLYEAKKLNNLIWSSLKMT